MKLGPYEIEGEIGRGGMGAVLRARAPDGRAVAIKLLLRPGAGNALERFERERRLLAELGDEQGFVPILDAGRARDGPFLVMPFVPGGTLRERLHRGPLPIEETIALGTALATALGRAHARRIVHRDLKPENVLFGADGRPLIADLGLAKHFHEAPDVDRSASPSRTGELRGSAGYMAPEQMKDAKSVGPAADVFSLGAVLYECLAGQPAFPGESPLDVIAKVERCRTVPLRKHGPEIPAWLASVVEGALARDPSRRPADGDAFARALAEGASRRPLLRWVAAIGALVIVLAGSTALVLRSGDEEGGRGNGSSEPRSTRAPARPDPRAGQHEAEGLVASARARLAKGDSKGTIDAATRAIELAPRLAAAWAVRGSALLRQGQFEKAVRDASQAASLDPNLALALAVRGGAEAGKDDLDRALADLDRAIEIDPVSAFAFARRSEVRRRQGDVKGALADADRAIELAPDLALGYTQRSALDALEHATSSQDADRAIELDPLDALAWANRAAVAYNAKDYARVLEAATRAIDLDPSLALLRTYALMNRALARRRTGDCKGAVDDANRILERDPTDAGALTLRSSARGELGDLDGALADATRAVELTPNDVYSVYMRATLRRQKGDRTGATADFERCVALEPNGPRGEAARAAIAEMKGGQ